MTGECLGAPAACAAVAVLLASSALEVWRSESRGGRARAAGAALALLFLVLIAAVVWRGGVLPL